MKRLYGLLLAAGMGAAGWVLAGPQSAPMRLDRTGQRGQVFFNHQAHETVARPEQGYPFASRTACAACHHSTDGRGVVRLWRCGACHGPAGHPRNPKNGHFDSVDSERAFHDTCIACHRASGKGPATCGECHRSRGATGGNGWD